MRHPVKRFLLPLLAAFLFLPVHAAQFQLAPVPQTYAAIASFTPGGNAENAVGFVNASASQDVRILQVQVAVSSAIATGGLIAFDIFTSTDITNGATGNTSTIPLAAPFFSNPDASVVISTSPTAVNEESSYPVFRPLVVNTLNSATTNLSDSVAPTAPANGGELKLPAGANRGLLIKQEPAGNGVSYAAGTVWLRILYTVTGGGNGSPN